MRYKPLIASALLVLMLVPLTAGFAQGNERIQVDFDRRGPMQGLKKLDKTDPRLVYALEDKDGHKLDPTKVRRQKGPLFLPKNAKLDIAEYRKFLRAELKAYRHRRNRKHRKLSRRGKSHSPKKATLTPKAPVIILSGPEHVSIRAEENKTIVYKVFSDGKQVAVKTTTIVGERPTAANSVTRTEGSSSVWPNRIGKTMWPILLVLLAGYSIWVLFVGALFLRARRKKNLKTPRVIPQSGEDNAHNFGVPNPAGESPRSSVEAKPQPL